LNTLSTAAEQGARDQPHIVPAAQTGNIMPSDSHTPLPPLQRAIREKCFHPTGAFVPFASDALEGSVPARFEEQVRRHSERLAVRTRYYSLTYAELNSLANRIAHKILHHCGSSEKPVALLFDHDAAVIGAMLGALKAGKMYIPLDPSYPRQRLEYMLRDSRANLLLTERSHLAAARSLAGAAIPVLDVAAVDAPSTSPETLCGPRSPAFVVYTSGSTGRPKGIVQNHRNLLHDVMNYTNSGHFCADDRFLLVSSISFGDSSRTIYGALLNGAALFPFDIHREGLQPLAEWIVAQKITIYRSIPGVFRYFVALLTGDEDFADLRLIYLGGEAVRRGDAALYRRHFPSTCALVNRVGTTETLTFRSYFVYN
jgi:non-ribosomal peptide synthetase component F